MSALADASLAKAADALQDARILQQSGRVAGTLSRAYYAIFHTAEALLASLGLEFSSHQAVIGAYGREFAKTGRLDPKFHRYLRLAFDERQIADYDKEVELTAQHAALAVSAAGEFLQAAQEYLARQQ